MKSKLLSAVPTVEMLDEYYSELHLKYDEPWEPYLSHKIPLIVSPNIADIEIDEWLTWDSYRTKLYLIKALIKTRIDYSAHGIFNLLDYGCGLGYYLYELSDLFNDLVGIDINKYSRLHAQLLNANKKKVKTLRSLGVLDLELLNTSTKDFDFVLAIDILEHTADPLNFLLKIKKYVNPNGYLIISTTLEEEKPFQKNFEDNYGHIWSWDKEFIHVMLEDVGYEIDYYMEYDAKRFTAFNECIVLAKLKNNWAPGWVKEQEDRYAI